ncbi:NUDIX domain-containing protein [Sphingomonas jatrophae]|uniref:GDP-mannose pyrophosphatase n=1 Tax=Sphingomonas jatrophae TaxID=1166337 RepID=A0A1I6M5R0_9SPHN|nr:NUDIX domain-containing protein [Sphingomonas jatrophae]SFS11047.1 nudix-type nucleoside diphosphatase, YffH/AdpP family [Sphingomonas jatrophae]
MNDAILGSRILYQGWLTLRMLQLRLSGDECERTLIEHPSGSALLAFDPARRVATVLTQTRYAPLFLGVPPLAEAVGGVGEAEPPAETARREALEEIGLSLHAVEPVGHVWMTPSTTTERVHLFLAEYGPEDRIEQGGGAAGEQEDIAFSERPLAELWADTQSGRVTDAKLFMLLHALRVRRPDLFEAD